MKRILLLPIIIALFLIPCLSQEIQPLSNEDKSQIIKDILFDTDFFNRGLRVNEKKNLVHLSTENIEASLVPAKIKRINIQTNTIEEIQKKSKSGFRYYVFEKFEIDGSRVLVSFSDCWKNTGVSFSQPNVDWKTNVGIFTARRIDYEYRKFNGEWKRIDKILRPSAIH